MAITPRKNGVCFAELIVFFIITLDFHHHFALGEQCKLQDFDNTDNNKTTGGMWCDTGCCLADDGSYTCCQELTLTRKMLYGIIVTVAVLSVTVCLYYRLRKITAKHLSRRNLEQENESQSDDMCFHEPPPPYWSCVSADAQPLGGATEPNTVTSETARITATSPGALSSPTSSPRQPETEENQADLASAENSVPGSHSRSVNRGLLLHPRSLQRSRAQVTDIKPPSYEEVEGLFPEMRDLQKVERGNVVVVFPGPYSRQVSETILKEGTLLQKIQGPP